MSGYGTPMYGPKDQSDRVLRHIRGMVGVLVAVHLAIFLVSTLVLWRVWVIASYYADYLANPLSGERVAATVTTAMQIVTDVQNVSHVAAVASTVLYTATGLDNSTAAQGPIHRRRALMSVTQMQDAAAELMLSMKTKVNEMDVRAPTDLMRYLMAVDWSVAVEPMAQQTLALVRYGEATAGAMLGALGTPVDPNVVYPINK